MRVSHAAFAAALVCAVLPLSEAHAFDDAGYFAVADRLATRVEPTWDAAAQRYQPERSLATAHPRATGPGWRAAPGLPFRHMVFDIEVLDPDIGRVAVTTPAYNTAIVAVNQGAFPYGGLDLARL